LTEQKETGVRGGVGEGAADPELRVNIKKRLDALAVQPFLFIEK
jgi:hypothetical protein